MNAGQLEPAGAARSSAAAAPDGPVTSADRIVALDFIRGIAVLGILFPNIVAYAHPTLAYNWPPALPGGATAFDKAVWLIQLVLIDGKFRGLFTLLFGAGMMLFIERAWARGSGRWLQARRLFWLAVFGLAHYFLVWTGDILFLYAASGFVALAMLRWEARTQLRVGIVWYLVGALFLTVAMGGQAAMESLPAVQAQAPEQSERIRKGTADMIEAADREAAVMGVGSYAEIVAYRLAEETNGLAETPIVALVETIPLMLIGMALYRRGLFERRFDRARARRWAWIGLVGGAILTVPLGLWAVAADYPFMLSLFVFGGPVAFLHLPMVLALAALLSLWAPTASQTWLGSRLVAAGRMAFSNYLGGSIVMMLVFQGWAGGLFGEFHRLGLLPFVLFGWLLMILWSKPWLARFRYGPLEWLWRCLTYGRIFPLRRTPG